MKKLTILASIFFLFFPFLALGQTILSDDFNSYSVGTLQGQGSWSCNSNGFLVDDSDPFEGVNAVQGNYNYCVKIGTPLTAGEITIYVKIVQSLYNNRGVMILLGDNANPVKIWIDIDANVSSTISYVDNTPPYWHTIQATIYNIWFPVQIEWAITNQFRYNINNAGWSVWVDGNSAWDVNGLEQVKISAIGGGATDYPLIDYISESEYLVDCTTLTTDALCTAQYPRCFSVWQNGIFHSCLLLTAVPTDCSTFLTKNNCEAYGSVCWFDVISQECWPRIEFPPAPEDYNFTTEDFGYLGNMFRDVLVFLFFPSADNVNYQFSLIKSQLVQKLPFAYISALQAEWIAGQTELTEGDYPIIVIQNPFDTETTITLLDFETTYILLGSTSYNLLQTIIGYLLWIGAFIFIWETIHKSNSTKL